jgi:PTH2 family peptidyl-tRNA hydrolase
MTSSLGFQPVPWHEDIRVSVWFIVGMVTFSILVGYYLAGVLDRMGLSRGRKKNSYEMVQHASSQEVEDDSDKEYENASSVSLPYGDMKMVLVIRTDLDMTKGKVAAQCCHACLAAYRHSQKDKLRIWGSAGELCVTVFVTES